MGVATALPIVPLEDEIYSQFQEIRLCYEFGDVDVDRYEIDGRRRAIMVAAREMETENLPGKSRNFVNRRFKYTHGYGIAMNTVNEFTNSGLLHLLIKNIPPQSEYTSLGVKRPEIYYGERTDSYVIVNSSEEEFDYPEGDNNTYVHYRGDGGVQINSFFMKVLFGYLYDGTKLLFSGYPTSESRIMFNRNIRDRITAAAPFLEFDSDPYIVMVNGELRWIIDAYTTSSKYPYSEHFSDQTFEANMGLQQGSLPDSLQGLPRGTNYIRNSIKTMVNPYNGDCRFNRWLQHFKQYFFWSPIVQNLYRTII